MFTYNYMSNYTHLSNKLHLVKICFCCFFDMHLYSYRLSSIAKLSFLIKLELLPACFCCSKNFNLSQSSSRSDGKKFVFEIPEAETIKAGDLSNFISVVSRVDLLPTPVSIEMHFFCKIIH